VLLLGEARPGGIATVCDSTEGVFDGEFIERSGVVIVRPFFEMGVIRMARVGDRFE
jgi:hypothetical protein